MAHPASPASPQHILLPVRLSTIAISLAGALLLNFLPWSDLRYVPDFVALVLVFWCVRQPRIVGLGLGWVIGLLSDAGNGALLGQYALTYSILAFLAITLSRRILWFPIGGQMLHVGALLLVAPAVTTLVRVAAGAAPAGWSMLVGPLLGAVLWAPLTWILLVPQRRPIEVDETRPI